MRYSLKILGQYISGKWSEDKIEHWLRILGLNPLLVKEGDDVFIELEIPSNRGDLLSAFGIVRALAPCTGIEPGYPEIDLQQRSSRTMLVEITSPEDCFLYAGRVIESVSVEPSSGWLKERVLCAGFRSVNNVVDITNLVFWEYGQPLHAFDLDRLEEKIVVRRAEDGEEITTLDGTKRHLNRDVLVISDSEKPVAIAGIMGGLNSEVGYHTKNIFIESAFFNPVRIRRGSKYLGMATDASARFEKGTARSLVVSALDRCCALINQLCGGNTGPVCVAGSLSSEKRVIYLSIEKISEYLGCEIPEDFAVNTLKKLGCSVESGHNMLKITVPDIRNDLELDVDVIEEMAKYWGYDKIPESMPVASVSPSVSAREYSRLEALKDIFVQLGFNEVINLGLGCEPEFLYPEDENIEIVNPLSRNYAFLRRSMMSGLLQNIQENYNRKIQSLSIFEIGNIYRKTGSGFTEEPTAGIAVMNKYSLYSFKGIVEYILKKIGSSINSQRMSKQKNGVVIEFLQNNKRAGILLLPRSDLLKKYGIEDQEILLAEVMLKDFVETGFPETVYKAPSRTMPVKRDLSLVVPNSVNWEKVEEMLFNNIPMLEKIEIFDIYRGENIPEKFTGIAVSLTFHNPDSNLTKQDIEKIVGNVLEMMQKNFSIILRQ